jgi:hypothetical protein
MAGRTRKGVVTSLIAATAAICAWSASAQAATVTVGSPITGVQDGGFVGNNGASLTVANMALPEPGAHVTSPVTGTIVSWRAMTTGTGQYALRVLRPAGGDSFTGAGTSATSVASVGDHTFGANLPIQAGDLIGLDLPNNQGMSGAVREDASWGAWVVEPLDGNGTLPDGSTAAPNPIFDQTNAELAFNAVVQYPDPPASNPPGSSKKKCKKKKKHKRSAESAKKKKCKKKKKP